MSTWRATGILKEQEEYLANGRLGIMAWALGDMSTWRAIGIPGNWEAGNAGLRPGRNKNTCKAIGIPVEM
jgi:hypothetical protein